MRMGFHILADLLGCNEEVLKNKEIVQTLLNEIVEEAHLTKVGETFYQFQPHGVTGVILLAESHIAIHTWPEYQSAALDIFCCSGKEFAEKTFELFLEKFTPQDFRRKSVER